MSNYIHYKVWDEITYPLPNFNGATISLRMDIKFDPTQYKELLIHAGIKVKPC